MLAEVILSDVVYHSCVTHALTTGREEIMGLLIGRLKPVLETSESGAGRQQVAEVVHSKIIVRSDKRSDRVEVPFERLIMATEEAEALSAQLGTRMRVIGWYHSHPHITPYPSHVDLATQGSYQAMEPGWVGLIFSVFNVDTKKNGKVLLHSFQSGGGVGSWSHIKVPVHVVNALNIAPFHSLPPYQNASKLLQLLTAESKDLVTATLREAEECTRGSADCGEQATIMRLLAESLYQQDAYRAVQCIGVPSLLAMREHYLSNVLPRGEAECAALDTVLDDEYARLQQELDDEIAEQQKKKREKETSGEQDGVKQ